MTSFFEKGAQTLIICDDCRHVTWSNVPSNEELAKYYEDEYTESHDQANIQADLRAYYRQHAEELAGLAQVEATDLRIADVGCSYPTFLEEAQAIGVKQPLGVDWSLEVRDYAAERGITVMTPVEFADFEPGSLDVLRYSHALEHMPDPVAALTEHAAKLKVGGLLYVTQPNFPVFAAAGSSTDIMDSVWPTHLHFFNPISLRDMLDRAGFDVLKFYTVGDAPQRMADYEDILDMDTAKERLSNLADRGEEIRGEFANYPYFAAENSTMYAIKRG